MHPIIRAVRALLTEECRHRYRWPDHCCLSLVQGMADRMAEDLGDVSAWLECEDEEAAAQRAKARYGSVQAALGAVLSRTALWAPREPSPRTACCVAPGDVVLLPPGLRTDLGYVTVENHIGLIGPECRAWVWTPRRPAQVAVAWTPLLWMAVDRDRL